MEQQTTHTSIVGVVVDLVGDTCHRPYQKIRVVVQCDGEDPDEIVTLLTDYGTNYRTHDVIQVSRWRKGNVTSYRIIK